VQLTPQLAREKAKEMTLRILPVNAKRGQAFWTNNSSIKKGTYFN
jgi:hypothetical protein